MTDSETYRTAFHLHAPRGAVQRALNSIQAETAAGRRRRNPKLLPAAALVAALLVTTAGAELNSGAVTNLLAPMFGSSRTELLEEIGRPVGASASADGYTVTAEAIAGDGHKLLLAYSLVREDGQPIPEDIQFFHRENNMTTGKGGGVYSHWEPDPDSPSRMMFYEIYTADQHLPRTIEISLSQLFTEFSEQEEHMKPIVLAEGPWELSFTRRYPDTAREISAKGISFTDISGREYTVSSLSVSVFGFYVDGTLPRGKKEPELFDLSASAVLADGSVIELNDDSFGFSGAGDRPYKFRWQAYYKDGIDITMISPGDVVSLNLCGTTIPINS